MSNAGAPGSAVTFTPPPGFPGGDGARLPQQGAFAFSEVVALLPTYKRQMEDARGEWERARHNADVSKLELSRVRANIMVTLRIMGTKATGNAPIKTNAERREWADAEPRVQEAELEAVLTQSAQMVAKAKYDEARKMFDTVAMMIGMERDDLNRTYGQSGNQ